MTSWASDTNNMLTKANSIESKGAENLAPRHTPTDASYPI